TNGTDRPEGCMAGERLPWSLEWELLQLSSKPLHWCAYESVPLSRPAWASRMRGVGMGDAELRRNHQLRWVLKTSSYPAMRLRCTLRRDGRPVRLIEVDSSPGLSAVVHDDALKQGNRPSTVAAELMLRAMVQGLGLRILDAQSDQAQWTQLPLRFVGEEVDACEIQAGSKDREAAVFERVPVEKEA
ncbi:MAG: hypothetical protein AAFX99_04080, partial [Myxococcota bacterium]